MKYFRKYPLVAVIAFVSLLASMHFMGGRAMAYFNLTPATGFVPNVYRPSIEGVPPTDGCDNLALYASGSYNWFGAWVSARGAPGSLSTITVPYGTTTLQLQLNNFSVNCHADNVTGNYHLNNVHSYVVSVGANPAGATVNLGPGTSVYSPYVNGGAAKGSWGAGSVPFDYIPNGGFTNVGTNTYNITIVFKQAYARSNGTFGCAENGAGIANLQSLGGCADQAVTFPISVNVGTPNDPDVDIDAECNLVGGLATLSAVITANGNGTTLTSVGGSAAGVALAQGNNSFAVAYGSSGNATAFATNNLGRTDTDSDGYNCPGDPNRPPTGALDARCTRNAQGLAELVVDVYSATDPEGDGITVIGDNGIGNSFSQGGINGPWIAPLYDAPAAFSGTATMRLRDSRGALSGVFSDNYTCPSNNRPVTGDPGDPGNPTRTISASCSVGNTLPVVRELTVSTFMRDPDGGFSPVRIFSNGAPYAGNGYFVTSLGTFSSPTNFASPVRDGVSYTVTFQARDAQSSIWTTVGTRTYTCYRNPATIPGDLSCTIVSSGSIEPGASLQPSVAVTNTFNLNGTMQYRLTNSGGANVPGSPQSITRNPFATATYGAGPFNPIPLSTPGQYTQGANMTMTPIVPDDPTNVNCGGATNVTVNNMPYFRVLYGDIVSFNSSVRGWNRGNGPSFNGAATTGSIVSSDGVCPLGSPVNCGVASMSPAGGNPAGLAPPRSLTFANTGGTWGAGYGTGLGTFNLPARSPNPTNSFNSSASIPSGDGEYHHTSNSSVTIGATNVTAGSQVTIYSTSPAGISIGGNITAPSAGFATLADIPRIRIVATGNIYVWPSVTRIDAELISGAKIYTCHAGAGQWGAPGAININLYDQPGCLNPLVVNGALMARDGVKLTRVNGTLRNSTSSDGINNCAAPVANCANIAELIRFTPDLYFTTPAGPPSVSAELRYDSATALTPRF